MDKDNNKMFPDLHADGGDHVTCIESLCLRCHEQGVTRLMLTSIPFFKEVILSSFQCSSCHHHDSCMQSGAALQAKGVKFTLQVSSPQDLNRRVVKSEHASLHIPLLVFEQPPSNKADITTVEGLLDNIVSDLQFKQQERRGVDAELADKLDDFMQKLMHLKEQSFTLILDDPSGNSFIENPSAPSSDPCLLQCSYTRSLQQDIDIGCLSSDQIEQEDGDEQGIDTNSDKQTDTDKHTNQQTDTDKHTNEQTDTDKHTNKQTNTDKHIEMLHPAEDQGSEEWNFKGEVLSFHTQCPSCNKACQTNMKMIDIPHFKQVVVMATVCEACGHRDNEVKGGMGIEENGQLISLTITDACDLNRDLLKSETASVRIPELDFEMVGGTLGGRFTTVEGLLVQVKEQLSGNNPFIFGDSNDGSSKSKMKAFCDKLDEIISGRLCYVHLVLDDPAGSSYIQNLHAPLDDPHLSTHLYQRSADQDEELGIHDMKTQNY